MIRTRTLVAVLAAGALALSACLSVPQTTPPRQIPSRPPLTVATEPPVSSTVTAWPTDTRTCDVTPGLGTIIDVRYSIHENYDRIVFDIEGGLPNCTVQYVSKLIEDGSGKEYTIEGPYFIELVLTPAKTHTESGDSTLFPRAEVVNFSVLKSYDVHSDFEGVIHIGIGVTKKTGFYISWVDDGPTARMWIDLQH